MNEILITKNRLTLIQIAWEKGSGVVAVVVLTRIAISINVWISKNPTLI
jgi:hypothetical protein